MAVTTRYVSIAVVDIERFGSRPDLIQKLLRKRLREIVMGSLAVVGIDAERDLAGVIDRGDGFALLVDPSIDKERLTSSFVSVLAEELRRHALQSTPVAAIRLRLSLHAGDVTMDGAGPSGEAINSACRIVDLQVLRDALAAQPTANLAVALSDDWHRAVVRAGWVDGAAYRAADFSVKELTGVVHLAVPGFARPAAAPAAPAAPADPPAAPAPPGPPESAESPETGRGVIIIAGRDQIGRDHHTTITNTGDVGEING